MRYIARDSENTPLLTKTYFSVGGGFVVDSPAPAAEQLIPTAANLPFPYRSGDDLLRLARQSQLSISEMTLRNESCLRPEVETRAALLSRVARDAEVRRTWLPQ